MPRWVIPKIYFVLPKPNKPPQPQKDRFYKPLTIALSSLLAASEALPFTTDINANGLVQFVSESNKTGN